MKSMGLLAMWDTKGLTKVGECWVHLVTTGRKLGGPCHACVWLRVCGCLNTPRLKKALEKTLGVWRKLVIEMSYKNLIKHVLCFCDMCHHQKTHSIPHPLGVASCRMNIEYLERKGQVQKPEKDWMMHKCGRWLENKLSKNEIGEWHR